jgi:diadenylate cyclase
MVEVISNYFRVFADPATFGVNLLELLIIAPVVYVILSFLQGTRGARLLQGVAIVLVAGFLVVEVLADRLGLERVRTLYYPFTMAVLLTTLVVFQPELRRGLMRLGETSWLRRWIRTGHSLIDPIVASVAQLSKNKIGALIAIERDVGLGAIIENGVQLDARVTAELLHAIFWPNAPLHDMGVIIREGRIAAAGCQFPLIESEVLDRSLGSRHRAGVGLSLESDALIVIVSEETGTISVAVRGKLDRGLSIEALRLRLVDELGGRAAVKKDSLKAA